MLRRNIGMASVLPALMIAVVSCGGGADINGPETFENVAGTYTAPLDLSAGGVTLHGTVTLTLTQLGNTGTGCCENLAGTYAIAGSASDPSATRSLGGNATVVGFLYGGADPLVQLIINDPCLTVTTTLATPAFPSDVSSVFGIYLFRGDLTSMGGIYSSHTQTFTLKAEHGYVMNMTTCQIVGELPSPVSFVFRK